MDKSVISKWSFCILSGLIGVAGGVLIMLTISTPALFGSWRLCCGS